MYALLNKKFIVLKTGLTREEAFSISNRPNHAMPEANYTPAPYLGSKFDKASRKFIILKMEEVRNLRKDLLDKSDWRATVDYPGADKDDWLEYRQKLRDLPQDYPEITGLVLPSEPSGG